MLLMWLLFGSSSNSNLKFEMKLSNGASTELMAIHTPDLYIERSNHSIIRREIISKNECKNGIE